MYRLSHETLGAAAAPERAREGRAERGGKGGAEGLAEGGSEGGERERVELPPPGESSRLVAEARGGADVDGARGGCQRHNSSWRAPLLELRRHHASRLVFALGLFSCLAATTVLLDNWGPRLFQRLARLAPHPAPARPGPARTGPHRTAPHRTARTLAVRSRAQLAPTSAELPHALLLLLSAGDLAGILLSILLVDRIGRRGCFHLGFFLQAALYVVMALVPRRAAPLAALGFAATGCRCFGWEAAQMWVVRCLVRVRVRVRVRGGALPAKPHTTAMAPSPWGSGALEGSS